MQIGTGEEILTNPANAFVSEFTEDVDRSKNTYRRKHNGVSINYKY